MKSAVRPIPTTPRPVRIRSMKPVLARLAVKLALIIFGVLAYAQPAARYARTPHTAMGLVPSAVTNVLTRFGRVACA